MLITLWVPQVTRAADREELAGAVVSGLWCSQEASEDVVEPTGRTQTQVGNALAQELRNSHRTTVWEPRSVQIWKGKQRQGNISWSDHCQWARSCFGSEDSVGLICCGEKQDWARNVNWVNSVPCNAICEWPKVYNWRFSTSASVMSVVILNTRRNSCRISRTRVGKCWQIIWYRYGRKMWLWTRRRDICDLRY